VLNKLISALVMISLLLSSMAGLGHILVEAPVGLDDEEIDTGDPGPIASGQSNGFIENLGQFPDPDVEFYTSFGGGGLAFAENAVVISMVEPVSHQVPDRELKIKERSKEAREFLTEKDSPMVDGCTIRLVFEGGHDVTPTGSNALPGTFNYFIGDDVTRWATGVRSYSQVVYAGLYEGIDLVYMICDGQVKYEFIVHPYAKPADIRVRVEGHEDLSLSDGDLVISTSVGDVRDSGLVAFYGDAMTEAIPSSIPPMSVSPVTMRCSTSLSTLLVGQ
jgi:hypothetical protein